MFYQYLDGENWRHIYIVGDLHGCRRMLDEQLISQRFDPQQDLLISVGDLIDRGPDSRGCLALLDQPWFRCVRGNHEEMALAALKGADRAEHQLWQLNGGDWFYQLRGSQCIEARHALMRCRELPLVLHLVSDGKIMVIAHADYPASHYAWGQEVNPRDLVWSRERINQLQRGIGEVISGADDFWFGHTPLERPVHAFNQHYIDTGAVFGNTLTLVQVQ
ncbi:serine/threonine-protein phosphatase [Izhakiella australiensis]|uniref:Serine/threonine-protein phosphatase n=1 Tax=Izhakiella australiensis TaxID=1926881 RepID=A0A1S8YNT0_9GAMM|nr:metallophosphoesterase [Izhakiella australiensis]OON40515.1 serine/threonine-protein phosphatase [Izhakiella australiensis]